MLKKLSNLLALIADLFPLTFVEILYLPFSYKYWKLLKELNTEDWFKEIYQDQKYQGIILHNMKLKTFLLTRGNFEKVKTDTRYREKLLRIIKNNELI